MRLLLDQGLPRTTAAAFQADSFQKDAFQVSDPSLSAEHVGEIGLASADDKTILAYALDRGMVVVTLDADFHTQLVLSGARGPSVIRIRIEGLNSTELSRLLTRVIQQCKDKLDSGAMVTVTETGVRVRKLPLVSS
jgi:predicted nuclease of predicted toxin-antitoxin system